MDAVEKATQTQIRNIQARSGKTLAELFELIRSSGLSGHAKIRSMLKDSLGMGYGDANILTHLYLKSIQNSADESVLAPAEDPLSAIYAGRKASLRPLHDLMMARIQSIGPFEIAPKKGYLSLRRKKQFAMIGPGTKGRLEVGLNLKGVEATPRLAAVPPGGMCSFKVWLRDTAEVDDEITGWIVMAYQQAG